MGTAESQRLSLALTGRKPRSQTHAEAATQSHSCSFRPHHSQACQQTLSYPHAHPSAQNHTQAGNTHRQPKSRPHTASQAHVVTHTQTHTFQIHRQTSSTHTGTEPWHRGLLGHIPDTCPHPPQHQGPPCHLQSHSPARVFKLKGWCHQINFSHLWIQRVGV